MEQSLLEYLYVENAEIDYISAIINGEFFDLGEGIDLWTQIVYGTKVYKNNLCGFNILTKEHI